MNKLGFLESFFKSEVVKCFMYFKRVRYDLYLKSSSVLFQIIMSNYLVLKMINVFMRHGKKYFAFSSFLKAMFFLRRRGILDPISDLCRVLYENEAFFDYKWIIPFSKKKSPFQLTRIIEGKSRWLLPLRFLRKEYVRMEFELFRLFLLKKRNLFKCFFIRLAFFFFRIIKIHFSLIRLYFLKRAWFTLKSLRKGKKKKSKAVVFSDLLSIRNKRRVLSVRSKLTKWNWTRGYNWRRRIFRAKRRYSISTVSSSSVGFKRRNRKLWWGLRPVGRHLKKRLSLGK
jgi:hypothetical protein